MEKGAPALGGTLLRVPVNLVGRLSAPKQAAEPVCQCHLPRQPFMYLCLLLAPFFRFLFVVYLLIIDRGFSVCTGSVCHLNGFCIGSLRGSQCLYLSQGEEQDLPPGQDDDLYYREHKEDIQARGSLRAVDVNGEYYDMTAAKG